MFSDRSMSWPMAMARFARRQSSPTADMLQLRRAFKQTLAELRRSRLGQAGRDPLYALPWYAVIGAPGAGKTSLLHRSGLRLPTSAVDRISDPCASPAAAHPPPTAAAPNPAQGPTQGPEPLPHPCDVWLTNDAVLLDTPGHWTTGEDASARDSWFQFLQLLRTYRPKQPLNGVIVAHSFAALAHRSPNERTDAAERLRTQLEDLMRELRIAVPVYVLITHCDQIAGFCETFSALPEGERGQVLGFTLPQAHALSSPEAAFQHYVAGLVDNLRDVALSCITHTRELSPRAAMYAFVDHFAAATQPVSRFVAQLFAPDVYRETTLLRGVYFTSAVPQVHARSSEPPASMQPRGEPSGYFLRELFLRVICADSRLAHRSPGELRARRNLQLGLTAVLSMLALALSLMPAWSFLQSRQRLADTAAVLDHMERALRTQPTSQAAPGLPATTQALLRALRSYERHGGHAPRRGLMSTGMNMNMDAYRVLPALRRLAAHTLRRQLVRPLAAQDARALRAFGQRYAELPAQPAHKLHKPTPTEHAECYRALKLQLVLSDPTALRAHADWARTELLVRGHAAALPHVTAEAVDTFVTQAVEAQELAIPYDEQAVGLARAALSRSAAEQQALDTILARVSNLGFDLDLQRLVGYTPALTGTQRVRGAFTRRGYAVVRALLESEAPAQRDESWVLGRTPRDGDAAIRDNPIEDTLQTLYFRAYAQEWRRFLSAVHVSEPLASDGGALTLLNELTSGEPTPLERLFQGVAYNVKLPAPTEPATLFGALHAVHAEPSGHAAAEPLLLHAAAEPEVAAGPNPFDQRQLARAFEDVVRFGVPTPAEAGDTQPAATRAQPSKPALPIDSYLEQLTYLRDALQQDSEEPSDPTQRRQVLQTAQRQVHMLIQRQPASVRPLLEALLWPPLRSLHLDVDRDATAFLGQKWCSEVVTAFERGLKHSYPLNATGHDARLSDFDAFYAPDNGVLWKFTQANLSEQLQLTGARIKYAHRRPGHADLQSRALLAFLQRSQAIANAFYADAESANHARIDLSVRFHSPSPDVDKITLWVGGQQLSQRADSPTWQKLSWPGTDPMRGAALSVQGRDLQTNREIEGVWGLLRLLESGSMVRTPHGTLAVTWRTPTRDVPVTLELRTDSALSALFAPQNIGERGSIRGLGWLHDIRVLAPRRISRTQRLCRP